MVAIPVTTAAHLQYFDLFGDQLEDPEVAALAARSLEWANKCFEESPSHGELVGPLLYRHVVIVSVYTIACRHAASTPRSEDLWATLLLVFFGLDDSSVDIPDTVVDDSWSCGRFTPSMRLWLAGFHELESTPLGRRWFSKVFHDYLRAAKSEFSQETTATIEAHWASRNQTVFVWPFIVAAAIVHDIDIESMGDLFESCCSDSTDAIWLANDLGSRGRLRESDPNDGDINILDTYRRIHGWTEEAAYDHAIHQYNHLIDKLHSQFDELRRRTSERDASIYIDMLCSTVEGNLVAMQKLGFRYAGIGELTERTKRIR